MMPPFPMAQPRVRREEHRTLRASVVISGDDIYEDLFTASCELQDLLTAAGFAARVRFGGGCLIDAAQDDLVVLYTAGGRLGCIEQDALAAAVRSGMGLLAIHSTALPRGGALDELTGVAYDSHGPVPHESRFTVHIDRSHPLFAHSDVPDAATIEHEHYRTVVANDVRVAAWRVAPYGREPLVLTRLDGTGRTCWVQFGHDMRAWGEPIVRDIITAAARWATPCTASGIEE